MEAIIPQLVKYAVDLKTEIVHALEQDYETFINNIKSEGATIGRSCKWRSKRFLYTL